MAICWGYFDGGEGERVGDFEISCLVHADQKAGRGCREGLRAVFYYLHDNLSQYQLTVLHAQLTNRTNASSWTAFKGVSFLLKISISVSGVAQARSYIVSAMLGDRR